MILLAVAVTVALVRALLVQSFVVPSGSMEPTVHIGDRILVSRLAYQFGGVHRGDVVVFDGTGIFAPPSRPAGGLLAKAGADIAAVFSMPVGAQDYVKRVIGLPGERVACCDGEGRITVDDRPLVEPYLPAGEPASTVRFDVTVPPGRLWVMGDHRSVSADSRAHLGDPGGGTVPEDRVVGRVIGVYWPFPRAGRVSGGQYASSTLATGPPSAATAEGRR